MYPNNENEAKLLSEARELVKNSERIAFFGGAGVSTASGLRDFRGEEGIYNMQQKYGVSYETILSRNYFYKHPETFFDFYKSTMVQKVKPNAAHYALAEFDTNLPIITQNIDNLHQEAGSENVYELHGTIMQNHCVNPRCRRFYTLKEIMEQEGVPYCRTCGAVIKPDVVLYGEGLGRELQDAFNILDETDLLIVAGSSLSVWPAASLVEEFAGKIILINNDETPYDDMALVLRGKIEEILPALLRRDE